MNIVVFAFIRISEILLSDGMSLILSSSFPVATGEEHVNSLIDRVVVGCIALLGELVIGKGLHNRFFAIVFAWVFLDFFLRVVLVNLLIEAIWCYRLRFLQVSLLGLEAALEEDSLSKVSPP